MHVDNKHDIVFWIFDVLYSIYGVTYKFRYLQDSQSTWKIFDIFD